MKPPSPWRLIEQGQFELAYQMMTREMNENPDRVNRHIYNRGLCLLLMDRRPEALADFQTLQKIHPDVSGGYIASGIAFWSLNQKMNAVESWKRGIDARYTDAAGGVEVPALLFFAASRLGDSTLEKETRAILRKRWKRKSVSFSSPSIKNWPGPIAGFLLEKLDEKAFLEEAKKKKDPVLEKRRLTQVHFWIGLSYYRQGNIDRYQYYLLKSLSGHTLEPEYYLAKYELENPT